MANFIELHVVLSRHKTQFVNMDVILEICPSRHDIYGARLICPCTDSDGDYMNIDVKETPEQILEMI